MSGIAKTTSDLILGVIKFLFITCHFVRVLFLNLFIEWSITDVWQTNGRVHIRRLLRTRERF